MIKAARMGRLLYIRLRLLLEIADREGVLGTFLHADPALHAIGAVDGPGLFLAVHADALVGAFLGAESAVYALLLVPEHALWDILTELERMLRAFSTHLPHCTHLEWSTSQVLALRSTVMACSGQFLAQRPQNTHASLTSSLPTCFLMRVPRTISSFGSRATMW